MPPSSEWRFHLDILRARPDIGAIVHNHPPYGCALAMLHRPILAAHYMIALFGGPIVKCVKYAPYGTKELSDLAVEGLGDRFAVLLGNHGAISCGADLASAMNRCAELENLARTYYMAIAAGSPEILSDEEVMRTVERFKAYGAGVDPPRPEASRKKNGAMKTLRAETKALSRKKAVKTLPAP
jgi:L-fuculose-phosphate aldolase